MKKFLIMMIFVSSLIAGDGKILYSKYGCYGCHGSDASGTGDYPKLAHLPTSYIEKRLTAYKKGLINSNRANIMKAFAKKLSKKEIHSLAEYLHSLKVSKDDEYEPEFITGDSAGS